MEGDAGSTGRPHRVAWVGGGVAVVAIIQFLPDVVDVAHLQTPVGLLASVLILLAGLVLRQIGQRRAVDDAALEREKALSEALLRSPAPQVRDVTPDDVGTHVSLATTGTQYVRREADARIDETLRQGLMLIVFGPVGAGKSRSAFEALRRCSPNAIVIAPRDGASLERLLAEQRPHVLGRGNRAGVLWLDGLDRYLETLRLDQLQRFLAGPDPVPIDRFLARLPVVRRWLKPSRTERWRPGPDSKYLRKLRRALTGDRTSILLVATIRDDVLGELIERPTIEGIVLRQLLTRGRGVPLLGELTAGECTGFEEVRGTPPPSKQVSAAFPRDWKAGWTGGPHVSPSRPPERQPRDAVLAMLLVCSLAALLAFVYTGRQQGWTVPPSLKRQVRELQADRERCERAAAYPKSGAGLERTSDPNDGLLVTIVDRARCGLSDEVRFDLLRLSGRLREVAPPLEPPSAPHRRSFSCVGPAETDPCHVTLLGDSPYVAGAFRAIGAREELPVVAFHDGTGVRTDSPSPPANSVPVAFRRTVELPLGSGPRAASVTGTPATITAVAPDDGDHPALLLLGYEITSRHRRSLHYRIWRLRLDGDRPRPDGDCVVLRRGRRLRLRTALGSPAEMRRAMQPDAGTADTRVMC